MNLIIDFTKQYIAHLWHDTFWDDFIDMLSYYVKSLIWYAMNDVIS